MKNNRMVAVLVLMALVTAVPLAGAEGWKSFSFKYKLNGKERGSSISIPQYEGGKKLPIRGVMQGARGPLTEFAHKNQVALLKGMDEGRGFSKELLAAAAKASGHPEVEFAGAIVEGVSKLGRAAADWAAANQERAIAVILDHSDCVWGHPPMVKGVPMFFNSTYANMFQGRDRRSRHYQWCISGFSQGQPCTSVIDINKKGGHSGRGQTTMTAVWLEEAMAHRVPKNIPIGKAYKLIDVDPKKCGGFVSVDLTKDGERSFHTRVSVIASIPTRRSPSRRAPSNRGYRAGKKVPKSSTPSPRWWIPGPKSAAMYLEWVKLNGGTVEKDESAKIEVPKDALTKR